MWWCKRKPQLRFVGVPTDASAWRRLPSHEECHSQQLQPLRQCHLQNPPQIRHQLQPHQRFEYFQQPHLQPARGDEQLHCLGDRQHLTKLFHLHPQRHLHHPNHQKNWCKEKLHCRCGCGDREQLHCFGKPQSWRKPCKFGVIRQIVRNHLHHHHTHPEGTRGVGGLICLDSIPRV